MLSEKKRIYIDIKKINNTLKNSEEPVLAMVIFSAPIKE
jgi:hypothetical protein